MSNTTKNVKASINSKLNNSKNNIHKFQSKYTFNNNEISNNIESHFDEDSSQNFNDVKIL